MTEEGMHSGGGHFDAIDSDLTVFALANGVDLLRGVGYRRLEWFTEGLERGIVVEAEGPDRFRVRVMSWRSGDPDARTETSMGDGVGLDDLRGVLTEAIDRANGLGAPDSE